MAYDLTVFQQKTQAAISGLPSTPDAKALLLIGKAIEATTPSVAVSDVVNAASAGVTSINGAATGALSSISTARANAITDVNTARDQAIAQVQQAGGGSSSASGISYSPSGSLTATNVQAALGQLDTLKVAKSAILDANGILLASIMPALAITDVFTVASQSAMLALTAQRGDVAIRTDTSTAFILATDAPGTLANWKALPLPAGVVMMVAGLSGPTITAAQLISALGLVIGTNVQAWDTDLDAIAAQGTTSYGRGLLSLADQAALASAAGTPSKSTGTLLRALTDDAAFLTAKSMADAVAPVVWTYAATYTPNMASFFSATMSVSGALTLANPTNMKPGQAGEIVLTHAAANNTVSYGSYWKFVGGVPTASTTSGAVDVISYRVITSTLIICSFGKGVA